MARIEMMIDGLRQSPASHQWVVVLKDKSEERYLPIWIGPFQAEALKRELTNAGPSEPIGDDPGFRSRVRSVKIDKLENNEFSAKLELVTFGKSREVDCPAAKALAIAVSAKVSIFAEEAILNRAGISVGAQYEAIR